jgi:hypothetical protein
VTTLLTREATKANDDPAEGIIHDGEKKVADEDEASLEEEDADGKVKQVRQRTPIKSCWIVPLLMSEIAEKPNMSNADMKHVVSEYAKETFITSSLLQNARTMARDEIFGNLATNVYFSNGLAKKMKECGIDVKVPTWLGNPFGIPWNSAINPILDLLNSGIFIVFFPIVKCVPANSKHVFSGLESSPAIVSSDFMNRKKFPLYFSVA